MTTFRYNPNGVLFGDSGLSLFVDKGIETFVALLNSKVSNFILKVINPTFNNQVSDIANIPIVHGTNAINQGLVTQNNSFSKQDWNSHETSWDFETSPLLAAKHDICSDLTSMDILPENEREEIKTMPNLPTNPSLLSDCVMSYKHKWERNFMQLHRNEEELNRQFIGIYGLEDELTPDVPLDEITILQQGEITIAED